MTAQPAISVIIKAFNEEKNIGRTLTAALAATRDLDAEIIVADSLSSDRTVDEASRFPVRVVQLRDAKDRGCGTGGQLGFQHSKAPFVFLMDGDMELLHGFLEQALAAFEEDAWLAGVGGQIEETSVAAEYRSRKQQNAPSLRAGPVDRLNGGGLYRRSALEDAGYFTNPNLHAFEEFELALRLREKGWHLRRLPVAAVRHYGHSLAALRLLAQRWRTRYAQGPGELLRASLGRPWIGAVIAEMKTFIAVAIWWIVLATLVVAAMLGSTHAPWALAILAALPLVAVSVRKRSITLGLYAAAAWCVFTAGMIVGLMRPQRDPARALPATVIT
jgi:glycosyltransferase involved in cell wall biosynthesis